MKKTKNNKKRNIKRMIRLMVAVVFLATVSVGLKIKVNEHREEEKRQEELHLAKEQEKQLERERQEKAEKIESVLVDEEYEAELRAIYAEHPELEQLLLNREVYPDWIIEYLTKNEEALEWTLNYPEYRLKKDDELLALAEAPIPEGEDVQNGIPLLFQWDQRWGYLTYGKKPIALEGCGPTCLSMAVIGLTGDRSITPGVVAQYSQENGFYVEDTGTSWSLIELGAKHFGLRSKQIMTWSSKGIKNALQAGDVVVCSVGEGDFTTRGHFILIVGLNEDGTVIVNDPNSRANSNTNWSITTILEQTKGMWQIGI